jgi:Tfp pilus assembly protein FimT
MKNGKIKEVPVISVCVRKKLTLLTDTVTAVFKSRREGVTLIELVIGMVLVAIIAYVVANALSTGIKGNLTTDYRKESLDQARLALDRMAKEIRNIKSRTDILTTNQTNLCFKATNILSDNTSATDDIYISYRLSGSAIMREESTTTNICPGSSGNTLAANITNLKFSYLKGNGSTDSSPPNDTKKIKIELTSTSSSSESVTLQTEVWLRNPVSASVAVPPSPPATLGGSLSGCTLTLSWSYSPGSPDSDTVSHKIYKCSISPITPNCFSLLAQVAMPTMSYPDTLTTSGQAYTYEVSAVDSDENESASFSPQYSATYTSGTSAPTNLLFSTPGGLTCTSDISTARLTMTWNNSVPGATAYKIYRNIYSPTGSAGTYTSYKNVGLTFTLTDDSLASVQNQSYKVAGIAAGCETLQSSAITIDVDPIWFVTGSATNFCSGSAAPAKDNCNFNVQQDSGQTLSLTGITVSWTGGTWQGGAGAGTIERIQIGGATKTAACVCGATCWANGALIPLTATNLNTATATTINIRWCTKNGATIPNPINVKWRYDDPLPDTITQAQGCNVQIYP